MLSCVLCCAVLCCVFSSVLFCSALFCSALFRCVTFNITLTLRPSPPTLYPKEGLLLMKRGMVESIEHKQEWVPMMQVRTALMLPYVWTSEDEQERFIFQLLNTLEDWLESDEGKAEVDTYFQQLAPVQMDYVSDFFDYGDIICAQGLPDLTKDILWLMSRVLVKKCPYLVYTNPLLSFVSRQHRAEIDQSVIDRATTSFALLRPEEEGEEERGIGERRQWRREFERSRRRDVETIKRVNMALELKALAVGHASSSTAGHEAEMDAVRYAYLKTRLRHPVPVPLSRKKHRDTTSPTALSAMRLQLELAGDLDDERAFEDHLDEKKKAEYLVDGRRNASSSILRQKQPQSPKPLANHTAAGLVQVWRAFPNPNPSFLLKRFVPRNIAFVHYSCFHVLLFSCFLFVFFFFFFFFGGGGGVGVDR
jgi:hypothetical protein